MRLSQILKNVIICPPSALSAVILKVASLYESSVTFTDFTSVRSTFSKTTLSPSLMLFETSRTVFVPSANDGITDKTIISPRNKAASFFIFFLPFFVLII